MAEPHFVVRPIEEADIGEWFRMRKLLWDATSDNDHKAEMLDIFEHTDSQLIVVADIGDGRLGGFLEASIRPFVEDCETDHVGYLEGWFVDPDLRCRGIGASLVDAAEMWARRKGCIEMASDAEVGNEASLKAHISIGYRETSRLIHLKKDLV